MLGFNSLSSAPLSEQGSESIDLSVGWVEADDVFSISLQATSNITTAWTEMDDTFSVVAFVDTQEPPTVGLQWIEEDDVVTVAAVVTVPATLMWTEENDTCSIQGSVIQSTSMGMMWTEQDDVYQIILNREIGDNELYTPHVLRTVVVYKVGR